MRTERAKDLIKELDQEFLLQLVDLCRIFGNRLWDTAKDERRRGRSFRDCMDFARDSSDFKVIAEMISDHLIIKD